MPMHISYVYIHIYIYIYMCVYAYSYFCIYIHFHVYIYICMCVSHWSFLLNFSFSLLPTFFWTSSRPQVIGLAVALLVAVGFGAWWFYFRKRNAATEVGALSA